MVAELRRQGSLCNFLLVFQEFIQVVDIDVNVCL